MAKPSNRSDKGGGAGATGGGATRGGSARGGANVAAAAAAAEEDARVDEIVRRGPGGTFAVAGVATAIVVAIYLLFYVIVYLPRGAVQ